MIENPGERDAKSNSTKRIMSYDQVYLLVFNIIAFPKNLITFLIALDQN